MKHDRAAIIAIIKEKRRIEEAVREKARAAIESIDPSLLLVDPEKTLRDYFVVQGIRIVGTESDAARKAGERFVKSVE